MEQNQKQANLNIRQGKKIHVIQASKKGERKLWVYILVEASKRTDNDKEMKGKKQQQEERSIEKDFERLVGIVD